MRQLAREIQLLDIEELEALNLIYLQQVFQPRSTIRQSFRTSDSGQPTAIHWKTQEGRSEVLVLFLSPDMLYANNQSLRVTGCLTFTALLAPRA
jgi:hypothetical protein